MTIESLKSLIQSIVYQAQALKDKYTDQISAPVNYVCIFSQNENEYQELMRVAGEMSDVLHETPTGNLYKITPLKTSAGLLKILKIRKPDSTKPERGDADFTVSNYLEFKNQYLDKIGFKLIERPEMEMMELMDSDFDVRVYFSHPPLDRQFRL